MSEKKTTNKFRNEVYNLVKDEYSVLDEYINARTKIRFKHNKCNHIYYVTPNSFLRNRRCPKCKESKGEKIIYNYLIDNSINFQTQYRFKDCVYKKPLVFDYSPLLY